MSIKKRLDVLEARAIGEYPTVVELLDEMERGPEAAIEYALSCLPAWEHERLGRFLRWRYEGENLTQEELSGGAASVGTLAVFYDVWHKKEAGTWVDF